MANRQRPHTVGRLSELGERGGRIMRDAAGVLLVKYGVVVWLDCRWPEDGSERWGTHQTEVNLTPRGVISSKFGPSYLCTFPLSLSDDEVSESKALRCSFPELTLFSPLCERGENRVHILLLSLVWGNFMSWARGKQGETLTFTFQNNVSICIWTEPPDIQLFVRACIKKKYAIVRGSSDVVPCGRYTFCLQNKLKHCLYVAN